MNDKASPRPWEVQQLRHCDGRLWLQIGYSGRGPIVRINCTAEPMKQGVVCESKYMATSEEEQIANATLIVEAVNSHDRIIAENERLREVAIRAIEYKSIVPLLAQQAQQALKGE